MRLHVLGCHGPFPCANGATSGYLIEQGEQALLVDCGSGVLGRLTARWDPAGLTAVLLSHLHFDHMSDMTVLQYYLISRGKKLRVFVPGEDHSPARALLDSPAFEVLPYPEKMELAGLEISTLPVRHPVPCRALRLTDGKRTFIYTGDTNDCPELAAFAREADLLLADGPFLEKEWKDTLPHMSASGAARLAREAGAKRLVLTHLPLQHAPETLLGEAREFYPQAQAAYPGLTIDL